MTTRYRHVTVTLDREYREDDAECILKAIGMVKGVKEVVPKISDTHNPEFLAYLAVKADLQIKLYEAIEAVFTRKP